MAKSKVSMEQFYSAVGKALTLWSVLEEALRDVFTRLILTPVNGSMLKVPHSAWINLGIVFNSSTNLRSKLSLITEIMERSVPDQEIKDEWNALSNRITDLYKRRNILAHGGVFGNEDGASLIVSDLYSDRRKSLNYIQVCACAHSFEKQAQRATRLAIRVNHYLVALHQPLPSRDT